MTDVLVGLAVLVGVVGVVVPLLPGSALVWAAVLVWALVEQSTTGWVVLVTVTFWLLVGLVVKYLVPGRRLTTSGVPRRTLVLGAGLGVVGFLVVPVVGLVLGFILGVYLAEVDRVGARSAWPSTRAALTAVGLSVLIELTAALLAALTWLVGAVVS